MKAVKGITLDFYQTLIHSRGGRPRGGMYHEYLGSCGLIADTWEHQVLYDVFEYYGRAYDTKLTEEAKMQFWGEFARRLFDRTNVEGRGTIDISQHAATIREIFGPTHFELYPEVLDVLAMLKKKGYPLGIISNWQCGLEYFCEELGIASYFRSVLGSADIGIEKPDTRIFDRAGEALGFLPGEILHVGDQLVDDVQGATAAGFRAALLVREDSDTESDVTVLRSLTEIEALL